MLVKEAEYPFGKILCFKFVKKYSSYIIARYGLYYIKLRYSDLQQATAEQFLSRNS